MRAVLVMSLAFAAAGFGGCIQDESAPNRLGMERPALIPTNQKNADNAEKRALEKPQRELPTGPVEYPGQSNAGPWPDSVLTLDVAATQPAATTPGPVVGPTIDDNKDLAMPGKDIPVPGRTTVIDKTWGQVYAMPQYPHRDWPATVATYQDGGVPANPVYIHTLWEREDYQPNHPCGTFAGIHADMAEVPWYFAQMAALPVLMLFENPVKQVTYGYPSRDPNYLRYLPVTTSLVPSPYAGTFQFEAATQPSTAPASDQKTISRDMPEVPVMP